MSVNYSQQQHERTTLDVSDTQSSPPPPPPPPSTQTPSTLSPPLSLSSTQPPSSSSTQPPSSSLSSTQPPSSSSTQPPSSSSSSSCSKSDIPITTESTLNSPKRRFEDNALKNFNHKKVKSVLNLSSEEISKAFDTVIDRLMSNLRKLESSSVHYKNIEDILINKQSKAVCKLSDTTSQLKQTIKHYKTSIEQNKISQNNCLTKIRNLKQKKIYYEYCKRLACSLPNTSGLWQFTDSECPVCLEQYKNIVKIDSCQHLICIDCIKSLYSSDTNATVTCPLCRHKFTGYETLDTVTLQTIHVTNHEHRSQYPSTIVSNNSAVFIDDGDDNTRSDVPTPEQLLERFNILQRELLDLSTFNNYQNEFARLREPNDRISETIRNA